MKKMFLIIALVIAGLSVNAQDSKVPSNISTSLNSKYPEAMNVKWEYSESMYKGTFSMGEKDYNVVFDNKGTWLSTVIEDIPASEIPMDIQESLNNSEYKAWQVGDFETTETTQDVTYRVGVKKGAKMQDLYFDEEGNMLRNKDRI